MATYRIKRGDSLSAIAKRFGTTVKSLQALNRIADKDVNLIFAGDDLKIPDRLGDVERIKEIATERVTPRRRPRVTGLMKTSAVRKPPPKEAIEAERTAPVNPRLRAIRARREGTPTESRGLMARSVRRGNDRQVEFEDPAFNLDPIKILSQQALLSVAERGAAQGLPKFEVYRRALSKPITEKDVSESVLRAMRKNTIRMFETGAPSMDDEFLGVGTRGDITAPFEGVSLLGGDPEKVKGMEAFTQYFTDPSKTQAFVTGETTRGNITLDENNNMILNDLYDFPDYDESKAKDLFMKVHNLFEPRGQTGKEGLLSGLFEVKQPRKMRINLGPAPAYIASLIDPSRQQLIAER